MLYVPVHDRGIGVASLLLHKTIMKAKRHRVHTIYLDNILPPNSRLYHRFGFKYCNRSLDNAMYLHVKNYTKRIVGPHAASVP
jgi:GNAT superfamily N-acetyltransferase